MLVLHTLPQPQAFQHLRHLRNLHVSFQSNILNKY